MATGGPSAGRRGRSPGCRALLQAASALSRVHVCMHHTVGIQEGGVVKRLNFRWALLGVAVAAGVFVMASSSATPSNVAYATGQIVKYKKIPTFEYRGKPFNAKAGAGKTIFNIPIASYIPYIVQTDQLMAKLAARYGYKFTEFPNQGQPSQWVDGMNQAIAQKVNLIILQGAPIPQLLVPQLAAAKKAGIPVLFTHNIDPSEAVPAGVDVAVTAPFQQAARLEADWVISRTKGKADVLIITSDEVLPTTGIKKALASEFAKRCGSTCKLKYVNVPINDWATKIGSETKAALTADPGINYIIPIYDSMSFYAVPAVVEAGKDKTVKIATYNGTPDVLKYIVAGQVVTMEVGESLAWLAHANMDAAMRILTGQKVPKKLNEFTPTRIFDRTNVAETGNPPGFIPGYGAAYIAGYKKIWSGK